MGIATQVIAVGVAGQAAILACPPAITQRAGLQLHDLHKRHRHRVGVITAAAPAQPRRTAIVKRRHNSGAHQVEQHMPGVVVTPPTQRLPHHIITIVALIVNRDAPQRFPMRTPLIPQLPRPTRRLASSPAVIAMANRTRWVAAPRSSRGARAHTMHRAERRFGAW